jgi:hypothetical protein
MRFAIGIAAGFTLAAAATSVTVAAPVRLSDAQFIAASRCAGLLTSKALGTSDGGALTKFVKEQSWGRSGYIYDQADQARDQAQIDAGRSGAEEHARLIAERDGVCRTFLDTATAGAPGAGHSS